ncbi:hypothetical protein [Trichococcus patagoniensis]|nr:hypothetical protein [Trichococcus patagoniensis]
MCTLMLTMQDGFQITKGVVAEGLEGIQSNVELIMGNNSEVYILSLSKEVIASEKYEDVANKLVIDFNDLVLLKVGIFSFEPTGNEPALVLNVKNVYNIAVGDYPVDYNYEECSC